MSSDHIPPLAGLLIDDDPAAGESALRFSSNRLRLTFEMPRALEGFAEHIYALRPAIVLLDYRLDERAGPAGEAPAKYKASALAQQLRDLSSGDDGEVDFPLVLHSAEENIKAFYRPEKTAHDLFDDVIVKGPRKSDGDIDALLLSLADGYAQLVKLRPYSDSLLEIFGLSTEQSYLIDHQEIKSVADATKIPHVFGRFILQRLVRRNGLLCDLPLLMALTGIDLTEPVGRSKFFEALSAEMVAYKGVFSSPASPTWWRLSLEVALDNWVGGSMPSMTATQRAQALSAHFKHDFQPLVSTWNNSAYEKFTHACCACSAATSVPHSVAVLEHSNSPLTDRRRICFDCVELDNDKKKPYLVIDSLDSSVAEGVRRGEIPRK